MVQLGLLTAHTFAINLILLPMVLIGALVGRWFLVRVDQDLFNNLVLGLSALAGILMLL
jgi:uncharacterized membrane protein YfcA